MPPPIPTPSRAPTRRRMAAGHAIVIAVVALIVGALLNADGLAETAERQPFGWRRTTAIVAVRPLQAVGDLFGLDRPRQRLAAAVERSEHGADRGAGAEASWARSLTSPPPSRPGATQTATATATGPAPRTWSAQDPLRLFIGGDSLVEQYGPALAEHAAARAPVTPTVDSHYSSGLTRPDYLDWPARLREVIAATDPDAIVLMFGANDAQNLKLDDGTILEFGSPPWQVEYRRRIATVMTEATRGERTLVWTGQPIMRSDAFGGRMRLLNTLYQEEARAHPGVTYLDSWALFAGPDRRYADYLAPGDPPQRLADGIHLTRAGGERLAAAAYALLAGHWHLPTGS